MPGVIVRAMRIRRLALQLVLVVAAGCSRPNDAPVERPPDGPDPAGAETPAAVEPPTSEPPPSEPPPPTAELVEGRIVTSQPIVFEADGDRIAAASEGVLRAVGDLLARHDEITLLRVEGHTDGHDTAASNQRLSEQRSIAIVRRLVHNGVDCRRLLPVGFGATVPLFDEDVEEGGGANARIEWVTAMLRGRAVGGMRTDGGGLVAGDPCAAGALE